MLLVLTKETMSKIFNKYKKYVNQIIFIQKIVRGYLVRKTLRNTTDNFTYDLLINHLNEFIKYTDTISKTNEQLKNKKIRMPNFPSEISENIAKFAIFKKYKVCSSWDTERGDLVIDNEFINIKLEIKGFTFNFFFIFI